MSRSILILYSISVEVSMFITGRFKAPFLLSHATFSLTNDVTFVYFSVNLIWGASLYA